MIRLGFSASRLLADHTLEDVFAVVVDQVQRRARRSITGAANSCPTRRQRAHLDCFVRESQAPDEERERLGFEPDEEQFQPHALLGLERAHFRVQKRDALSIYRAAA